MVVQDVKVREACRRYHNTILLFLIALLVARIKIKMPLGSLCCVEHTWQHRTSMDASRIPKLADEQRPWQR